MGAVHARGAKARDPHPTPVLPPGEDAVACGMTAEAAPRRPSLTSQPAWQSLVAHRDQWRHHLRELFADDPGPRRALHRRGRGPVPRLLQEPRHRRDAARCSCSSPTSAACAARIDAMFRGEQINVTENRAVLHVALRAPARRVDRRWTARTSCPRCTRCSTGWPAFADRVRSGDWTGHTGKRIRNVVNIGIGGSDLGPVMAYEALRHYSDARHDVPLRLERRRHRLRRGDARPRSGRDAVHRLVEDVHDAGDDDQRAAPRATWCLRALAATSGRWRKHFVAVSTNAAEVARVRHRHREHVRLLGLGRRPLLDGLGDRPLDDARDRPRALPRDARRLPRDGRALPHGAVRAQPAGADGAARPSGTTTSSARRPWRCCRTTSTSSAFRPTCSS